MMLSRNRIRCVPQSVQLEDRVVPAFLVNNVGDYDPTLYDPFDNDTYTKGSFRYAIQKAIDAGGGTIEFDTSVDLGGGVKFGDPITAANTIELKYGEVNIRQPLDANGEPILPLLNSVRIEAPKYSDPTKDYVQIQWAGWGFKNSPSDKTHASDWSVIVK